MAVARSVLEGRVAKIVIDTNTDTTDRIVPEIKKAQSDLEELSYKFLTQETYIGAGASLPTVSAAASSLIATPSDWLGPHGESFVLDATGLDYGVVTPPLSWLDYDDEMFKVNPLSFENPRADAQAQPKYLYIDPVLEYICVSPVADKEYTLWVHYYKRLATLAATETSNWWTENLEDYLVFRAASRVLNFNRDPEYVKYEVLAKAEYTRAKRADKRKRYLGQSNRIRPRRDVRASFTQRRM